VRGGPGWEQGGAPIPNHKNRTRKLLHAACHALVVQCLQLQLTLIELTHVTLLHTRGNMQGGTGTRSPLRPGNTPPELRHPTATSRGHPAYLQCNLGMGLLPTIPDHTDTAKQEGEENSNAQGRRGVGGWRRRRWRALTHRQRSQLNRTPPSYLVHLRNTGTQAHRHTGTQAHRHTGTQAHGIQ
jgi:hypothetical protein